MHIDDVHYIMMTKSLIKGGGLDAIIKKKMTSFVNRFLCWFRGVAERF